MREEAHNWYEQAKRDLSTADYLLEGERLDAASFYYQQAVEKGLKALYISARKASPDPTHSLVKLARELGMPAERIAYLRRLTAEYYLSRYPDAVGGIPFDSYEAEGVEETAVNAHEVMQWVEQQISRY